MKTETSMAIKDETSVKVEASVKLEASSLLSNGVTACPTRDHARTPAVESGMLAQRVLGECGPALYRHLDASSRRYVGRLPPSPQTTLQTLGRHKGRKDLYLLTDTKLISEDHVS